MADGKQIPGLKPGLAVSAALAKLLKARLAFVLQRSRQIAPQPEAVHQLRVGTRRAAAALRLAKSRLPAKKRQRVKETLTELRRAGGRVRDLDIFLATVHDAPNESTRAFLTGHVAHERLTAYRKLAEVVAARLPALIRMARTLTACIKPAEHEIAFGDHIDTRARRQLHAFNASLVEAVAQHDPVHLHQLRIQAKRLRYTIEVDGAKWQDFVKQIESLQTILGDWHDAHALQPRLAAAREAAASVNGAAGSPVGNGIEAMLRAAERRETKELAAFQKWSRAWQVFQKKHVKAVL